MIFLKSVAVLLLWTLLGDTAAQLTHAVDHKATPAAAMRAAATEVPANHAHWVNWCAATVLLTGYARRRLTHATARTRRAT